MNIYLVIDGVIWQIFKDFKIVLVMQLHVIDSGSLYIYCILIRRSAESQGSYISRVVRKPVFAYANTKTQISFAV